MNLLKTYPIVCLLFVITASIELHGFIDLFVLPVGKVLAKEIIQKAQAKKPAPIDPLKNLQDALKRSRCFKEIKRVIR